MGRPPLWPALSPEACLFLAESWTTFVEQPCWFWRGQYGTGVPSTIQHMCCIQRSTTIENVLTARKNDGCSDCRWCFVCGSRGEENMSWLEGGDGAPSVERGGGDFSVLLTDPSSSVTLTIKVIGLVCVASVFVFCWTTVLALPVSLSL